MMTHAAARTLLIPILCLHVATATADEELRVLPEGADTLLVEHLLRESSRQYERRARAVDEALRSPEAHARRREQLRRDLRRIVGDLPESRTPLNAMVTGVVECEGYRIEKVHFQSRPNYHVTANLYVPTTGDGPFPGVAVACNHSRGGKAAEDFQKACILLAKNGFVALIYDSISHGERLQLPDAPRHDTTTHTLIDLGALLVGRSLVGYQAWDGMASIDYLLSRDEVDHEKPVGLMGHSGGATQATFLMALDERVGPAALCCYIMQQQRKFETVNPTDGCQHLPGEGAHGIDHVDYLWMRSPKPTLILAAEQDFFEFASTKAAAVEAQRIYEVLDHKDATGLFSHNDRHSFSMPRRQAAAAWMKQWFLNDSAPVTEPQLDIQDDRKLQVTPTGQVLTSFEHEITVARMNLQRAHDLPAIARASGLAATARPAWKRSSVWSDCPPIAARRRPGRRARSSATAIASRS